LSLVGPVRHDRAYYLCRCCGQGLFPFDEQAGFTECLLEQVVRSLDHLTPG
jgi:hypothetical protein